MPPFDKPQPLVGSIHADTCGTCKFAQLVTENVTMVDCYGAPPTPLFAPTTTGGMQLVLMRPRMPRTEGACGQHKPKPPVLQS